MKAYTVHLGERSYDVVIGNGLLSRVNEFFDLDRKVLIVTDDGVPSSYAREVARHCREPYTVTVRQGEGSKTIDTVAQLCREMMKNGFDRSSCVVAVGGGVVGDLSGFAAASYMRGIDFYNIPTTVLSCVDSSVGGKTGVNLDGVKNIVGAFLQPRGVIADTDTLKTLPQRQISSGLAEAVKMALTFDADAFSKLEGGFAADRLGDIISDSVRMKINVVEQDEREAGLRKVLNFGHTIGHGIESLGLGLYHGECVALGMLPMCSDGVRAALEGVLAELSLPTSFDFDREKAYEAVLHDKKSKDGSISAVFVEQVGGFEIRQIGPDGIRELIEKI